MKATDNQKFPTTKTPKSGNLALVPNLDQQLETDPLRQAIRSWLDACRANGLSDKTIEDYQEKAFKFWWWWHDHTHYSEKLGAGPEFVTIKEAREFAGYLRIPVAFRWGITRPGRPINPKLSPASVASYGRTIKALFNWLAAEGYIEQTPFSQAVKFTSHREATRVVKTVAEEDLNKIFAYLNSPDQLAKFEGKRDRAILAFLLDSGVRRGELLGMKLEDVDYNKLRARVTGKTGERWVMFSSHCLEALKVWREARREHLCPSLWCTKDDEPVSYGGFSSIIRRIEDGADVNFHAHQLRHTYTSLLVAQGIQLSQLQHLLGHESPTTTNVYVHKNEDRLQQAYNPLSPLKNLPGVSGAMKRRPGRPRRQD